MSQIGVRARGYPSHGGGPNIRDGAIAAGRELAKPHVTMAGPAPIVSQPPLRIEGAAPAGSLPIDAELGGQEPRKR